MPKLSEILAKLEGEAITTTKKAAGMFSETLTAIDNEIKNIVVADAPAIKQDIEDVITNGIPIVWPLVTGGNGSMAIIMAGYDYFKSQLPHLIDEILMSLASELSLKVKAVIPTIIPAPITTIPSISPIIPGN